MKKNFSQKPSAFSLIELSIVILVIGILIAGIVGGNYLYKKAMFATAQSLTKSSPLLAEKGMVLWLETTLPESFANTDPDNGGEISQWVDTNPHSGIKVSLSVGASKPIYESNIAKGSPCVKFSGADDNYFSFDGSFLSGTDYTILVVEKRSSSDADNYFLYSDKSASGSDNQNLILGYKTNESVLHSQAGTDLGATNSNSYASSVAGFDNDAPKVMVFTSSPKGKRTYINGMLTGESTDSSPISSLSTLYLGRGYHGSICELVIFNKEVSENEIKIISQKFQNNNYYLAEQNSAKPRS